MRERLPLLAAALWWGSLTAIGLLAVPLLFQHLPTAALAGATAAKLFAGQTWVSLGCGMILLMAKHREGMAFVLAAMILALLGQFGVAPRILARENLALWHAVGSAIYAAQWFCAAAVLWKLSRPAAS